MSRAVLFLPYPQENLLFTPDWKLKVCDYGVSICLGEEVRSA